MRGGISSGMPPQSLSELEDLILNGDPTAVPNTFKGLKTMSVEDLTAPKDPSEQPPLVLKIVPASVRDPGPGGIRTTKELNNYTAAQLKEATFLIPPLTQPGKPLDPQTKSLLGAILRTTGRRLPEEGRQIQISGGDEREDNFQIKFVASPINDDMRHLPVSMIADMTRLMDHEPIILLMPPLEILLPDTYVTITYENGENGHIRQYIVREQLPNVSTTTTQYGLAPVKVDMVDSPDPETDGVELPDAEPSVLN